MDDLNRCDSYFYRNTAKSKIKLYFNHFMPDLNYEYVTADGVLRVHSRALILKWNEAGAEYGVSFSLEGDENAK